MTKYSKKFFLHLMKSQRVANVVVEYYSCATSARWLGGGVCTVGRVVGGTIGGKIGCDFLLYSCVIHLKNMREYILYS